MLILYFSNFDNRQDRRLPLFSCLSYSELKGNGLTLSKAEQYPPLNACRKLDIDPAVVVMS